MRQLIDLVKFLTEDDTDFKSAEEVVPYSPASGGDSTSSQASPSPSSSPPPPPSSSPPPSAQPPASSDDSASNDSPPASSTPSTHPQAYNPFLQDRGGGDSVVRSTQAPEFGTPQYDKDGVSFGTAPPEPIPTQTYPTMPLPIPNAGAASGSFNNNFQDDADSLTGTKPDRPFNWKI